MRIAIRVDSSSNIGTGHVARCKTLADALAQRGAQVCFVSRHLCEGDKNRIEVFGHNVMQIDSAGEMDDLPHAAWLGGGQLEDAARTCAALAGFAPDWLIVDHYALDARWELAVRELVPRVMVIDDLADRSHVCEVLLDQNLHPGMETRYELRVPASAKQLIGPRYALIKPEFRLLRGRHRSGEVRRLMVFFGGIDATNQTGRVIELLPRVLSKHVAVDVVIGAAQPYRAEIQAKCFRAGYNCYVQTSRMAEVMTAADLAIGAGGTAIWERASVGLPALVWPVADNQLEQVSTAADRGLLHAPPGAYHDDGVVLRHITALCESPNLLRSLSAVAVAVVDGAGVNRVCRALGFTGITMRRAVTEDSDCLFEWRNSEVVRRVSRNTDPIERSAHEVWLADTLANNDRLLLLGERNGQALGAVRFDLAGVEVEVSIFLAPATHGVGVGGDLLAAAELWLARERQGCITKLRAEVLGDNVFSRQMFLSAGYSYDTTVLSKRVCPDD